MSKYPQPFLDRMKAHFGNEFEAFIKALDEPVTTSIRINPKKQVAFPAGESPLSPPSLVEGQGERILWTNQGYYLHQRPSFTFDPLFHAGAYYVQESSSMFLEQAFKATGLADEPIKVLDLCAAPGGKSTHLLSLINEQSLLVSNELIANRNHILRQNLARWGYANVVVTQNKAADFAKLNGFFDVVVVDAPCSGEGLFRKDKNAVNEWSEANVNMCAERQRDILINIVQCLKPGGCLIYSTCTFEETENIDNINYLLNEQGMEMVPIENANEFSPQLTTVSNGGLGYAFCPHKTKGEGFFISVLSKNGNYSPNVLSTSSLDLKPDKLTTEFIPHIERYIDNAASFSVLKHAEYYNILPSIFMRDYKYLAQQLYIRNAGIAAGEIKGKDFIPAHELSLYEGFNPNFPSHELDLKTAISYLKAETISIATAHKGWMAVKYKGANLGFVKVLPNRINNYFPKEWRILKAQA